MNALVCARLLVLLALGLFWGAVAAVFVDVWYALVLGTVAALYAGAAWLAVESHRSVQEWQWRERMARR